MTPDAALDHVALLVGVRLMGSDAQRRLRIALARSPDFTGYPGFNVDRLERIDAMLEGRLAAETLQDRLDLARAQRERTAPPFDSCFWLRRTEELIRAGFSPEKAASLIQQVRSHVDNSVEGGRAVLANEEQAAC